jgi:hypothetical protein
VSNLGFACGGSARQKHCPCQYDKYSHYRVSCAKAARAVAAAGPNTPMSDQRYPRGTAYHEADHAVVAWSFGLHVGAISVVAEDACGESTDRLRQAPQPQERDAAHCGGVGSSALHTFRQTYGER